MHYINWILQIFRYSTKIILHSVTALFIELRCSL